MKKVLSLVLVLTLVLGSFSFAFAAPSDVVGTDYEDAVERLSQLKVLTGYPDGTFKPNNTITRAEFAAAVVRVKGLESAALAAQGSTVFTDVPAGNWAAGYVNIASKLGIVKGMGDGTFAPSAPVTYEQAVTMVMRALNYEATAEARGGYPYGYLIVANENGLLDAVKGTQGLPAVRGLVAQLLDNALEIPMMIQVGVGFNSQPLWVKSGTQNTEEVNLLDDLGFTKVARERVVSFDASKKEIKLEKYGKVKVVEGFDFEEVLGLRITAWLDGYNKVIVYTKADTPKFDATTMDKAKIKLVTENKSYVVNKDAKLSLNGETLESDDAFAADYAKLVFNSDDEIVWAQGFTFDGNLVVEKIKDKIVYSYDNDELDIAKYTVIKEGKTLSFDDIEEEDILFFNKDNKFAVVHNNNVEGEIERVYASQFKFEGKVYGNGDVKFLDEGVMGTIDADILAAMKDEGEVEVFFNFHSQPVLVVGARGETKTDFFYGLVAENTEAYNTRGKIYYTFDVLNPEGKVVKYDVTKAFADKYGDWETDIAKNTIVKITVDKDNSVTKVEKLDSKDIVTGFGTSATYAEGYKLQPGTVVFWNEGGEDIAASKYDVLTWEKAAEEFSKVKDNGGVVYATSNDRAAAIYVTDTNVNSKNDEYTGLITKVRTLKGGSVYEVTIKVFGETKVFLTELDTIEEGTVITIVVGDKSGEIDSTKPVDSDVVQIAEKGVSTAAKTIKATNGKTYELTAKAVVYDKDLVTAGLRDLKAEDYVEVYYDGNSTRFVNYVIVVDGPKTPVVDKAALNAVIVTAEAKVEDEYTVETWGPFATALAAAKAAAAKADATQEEVDAAKDDLTAKMTALAEKPAGPTVTLTAVKNALLPINTDYTVTATSVEGATKYSITTLVGGTVETESEIVAIGTTVSGATNETITVKVFNDAEELLHTFTDVATGVTP